MLTLVILTALLIVTSAAFTEADRGNLIVRDASKVLNATEYSAVAFFSCQAESGVYPDILDCKRFWSCNNWQPVLYVCPVGQFYDVNNRRCFPKNGVICGRRPIAETSGILSCQAESGIYPDTLDCGRFWSCKNWQPNLDTCPKGQLYDTNSGRCLPKNEVNCGTRPQSGGTGGGSFLSCQTQSGIYLDKLDCRRFWVCNNWQPILFICPKGLIYDKNNRCVRNDGVNCGRRPIGGSGGGNYVGCQTQTGVYPDVRDCRRYWNCNNWQAFLHICDEGQLFDTKSNKCLPENEVDCGTRPIGEMSKSTVNWEVLKTTEVPKVSTEIKGKDMLPTSQKPTLPDCETKSPNSDSTNNIGKTVFPEGDSTKDTWRTKSPNGDSSDSILRTEFPSGKTDDWTPKEIVTTASPIPSTQQLFTTKIPPATTSNFKESTLKPVTTPNVYDYTRLTTIGTLLPEGDDKHFRCPAAFGIYPHPQDCSKYYVCVMAKVSVGTCKESKLYDVSTFQCQKRENVNCGTRFDPKAIEISFECPIAFGIYPHPRDCSKFVICFAGKVSFGDCHPTQRFDIRYYQCRIRNDVDCGDKFNP